jgi:hypothetical protein
VSDFGDWEPDDSFDTAPADVEQVARKLQRFRREADLSRRVDRRDWDDLSPRDRAELIGIALRLLSWWRRSGLR